MAGLDQVQGPHWSQILALYGKNGSINEVLRARNQVQLKDKARNLKLFFLKSGCEVPYFLKSVTGELKTRAPTQAAKREKEERDRLVGREEQSRMAGVMALAGGLRDGSFGDGGGELRRGAEGESISPLISEEKVDIERPCEQNLHTAGDIATITPINAHSPS